MSIHTVPRAGRPDATSHLGFVVSVLFEAFVDRFQRFAASQEYVGAKCDEDKCLGLEKALKRFRYSLGERGHRAKATVRMRSKSTSAENEIEIHER